MGTSSRIATHLDAEMLLLNTPIFPAHTSLAALPLVTNLPVQLGGRYLLRYLMTSQLGTLRSGTSDTQFVTPTPYAPEETISWLTLPPAAGYREWVLLLDPTQLADVRGPRQVRFGGGIEYVLVSGFPAAAIVNAVAGPPGSAGWEIQIR